MIIIIWKIQFQKVYLIRGKHRSTNCRSCTPIPRRWFLFIQIHSHKKPSKWQKRRGRKKIWFLLFLASISLPESLILLHCSQWMINRWAGRTTGWIMPSSKLFSDKALLYWRIVGLKIWWSVFQCAQWHNKEMNRKYSKFEVNKNYLQLIVLTCADGIARLCITIPSMALKWIYHRKLLVDFETYKATG